MPRVRNYKPRTTNMMHGVLLHPIGIRTSCKSYVKPALFPTISDVQIVDFAKAAEVLSEFPRLRCFPETVEMNIAMPSKVRKTFKGTNTKINTNFNIYFLLCTTFSHC